MTRNEMSRILATLPGTALRTRYDPIFGRWLASLRGAHLADGDRLSPLVAQGEGSDDAVEALYRLAKDVASPRRIVTLPGPDERSAWRLGEADWHAIPDRDREAPPAAPAPRTSEPDVEACIRVCRLLLSLEHPDRSVRWSGVVSAANLALPGARDRIRDLSGGIPAIWGHPDRAVATVGAVLWQDARIGFPRTAEIDELVDAARLALGIPRPAMAA